jgi:hypothetical protein
VSEAYEATRQAFYDLAIKERDYERVRVDHLTAKLAEVAAERERIAEPLAEALLLAHEWSGPKVRHREDLTPAQRDARMIYHHIHTALKRLAKSNGG